MTISVDILNVNSNANGLIPTLVAIVYSKPENAASIATGVIAKFAAKPKINTATNVPNTPKPDKIGAAICPIKAVIPTVPQTVPMLNMSENKICSPDTPNILGITYSNARHA